MPLQPETHNARMSSKMGAPLHIPDRFVGLLLGTAVGDALGLPAEGLSRRRIERWWHGQWRHRFVLGRGMISDDTEHTLFVAQALLTHSDDPLAFQRCLAWKLRLWLLGIPAGIGFATLRAILKLWLGFPSSRSGVFSAGNGPAMRSAIIGAYFADQPDQLNAFVRAAARLTHTDPKAEIAALVVAQAVAWVIQHDGNNDGLLAWLQAQEAPKEWQLVLDQLAHSLHENLSTIECADRLGLRKGVTGYCFHTVAIALYAWLRYPRDFRQALESVLNCGGDTDTVGAIAGAMAGASVGKAGIPQAWIQDLWDWPRSIALFEQVALRLAEQKVSGKTMGPVPYFWPALLPRNILFLIVVLGHGFRRLGPPYG